MIDCKYFYSVYALYIKHFVIPLQMTKKNVRIF